MNTDMKNQTAVEFLGHELNVKLFYDISPELWEQVNEIFKQAKAMEKEQIVEAYSNGWHDGQDVILQQVKHINKGGDDAGQELYNETYGGDK
jgi:hypothetical protein